MTTIPQYGSVFALALSLVASCCPIASATKHHDEELKLVATHLANFDDLDYNVFTNQKWTELHRSHSHDILVHWPDGHVAKGIDKHIDDLRAMFVWAPDTRIKEHPVKLGQGEWTAVIGVMEGTFTKPMPIAEGNSPRAHRERLTRSKWQPLATGRMASWTRSTYSGTTKSS
jgi:hypothetical protein